MNKRIKKKHERYYWLRNAKERKVSWQEFLDSFTRKLTPEEIAGRIAQGTEDAKEESTINDYTTPLEPVKPIKPVKAEVVTLEEQKNEHTD